ncbi:MAG: TlpA family protein disulfide reductase [Bacteroidetes bacterium]|nr:TlpA family protein disulfide reductase [Bacteroidota bacterium]
MQRQNIIFKSGITLVISLLLFCKITAQENSLKTGLWQGYLQLNDSTSLPFDFEVKYDLGIYTIDFINASERITTNEIAIQKDSVFIKMPVFDSEFKCKISDGALNGVWINHGRKDKNVIPFNAHLKGFVQNCLPCFDCDILGKGNWEATFSPGTKESSKAIGIFENINVVDLQGTFLTETGDYRFLVGLKYDQDFELSCFDGSHAFLFKGKIKGDSIINGHFYSGAHHHETWVAKRNDKFELRNPDSLTYLKPGFSKVDFNFKNVEGKNVSLQDEKFKNKVVIIQIMGSWCPNCMDETKFLAPFYDKYNSKGLEVVALAFERTDDFNKAISNVQRSKTRFNAKYEFLITMKTGKDQASEALPMLNEVMAFPTTIYIDKKGIVRKIYTGFNGPATGDAHTKFVEETTRFVEKLLAE